MDKSFGSTLAFEVAMAMMVPPMVPAAMLASISRVRDGMNHNDCGDNSASDDGGDHQSVGTAGG